MTMKLRIERGVKKGDRRKQFYPEAELAAFERWHTRSADAAYDKAQGHLAHFSEKDYAQALTEALTGRKVIPMGVSNVPGDRWPWGLDYDA